MNQPLLQVKDLTKHFNLKGGFFNKSIGSVKAVDKISFSIKKGDTLGIVGESGCGKTTLVSVLLNLLKPTSGQVLFDNKQLFQCSKNEMRELRQHIQIVFQDPFWSLNPRWLIKDIIGEPLKVHLKLSSKELIYRVELLRDQVGLPRNSLYKYPHEFSGGQRQRIAIARSLALNPKLLVLDEPTSSVDIFSQSRLLELLKGLRERLKLTYILISHDLSVVHYMADHIMVMYLGEMMEYGNSDDIFQTPVHPYTQALLQAIPTIETESLDEIKDLKGIVPSAINPPTGCRFNTRCPEVINKCREIRPEKTKINKTHMAYCHLLT